MNTANTVFLIIAAVLVLMMTPGLAFFYGGLVSKKNVVNTMLSVFIICALAIVLFVAFGYELCFNGNVAGIFGKVQHIFLSGSDLTKVVLKEQGITAASYLLFEMMFAIITPALFVGATVGRMRFNFLLVFVFFWSVLVYYPLVHMVWGTLSRLGDPGLCRRHGRAHQRRDHRPGLIHLLRAPLPKADPALQPALGPLGNSHPLAGLVRL